MRLVVTLADAASLLPTDVLVDADPSTPMGEIARLLSGRSGNPNGAVRAAFPLTADLNGPDGVADVVAIGSARGGAAATLEAVEPRLYLDGLALDPAVLLRDSGVLEGSILGLGSDAVGVSAEPRGTVELRLVAGAGAGTVHLLGPGESTIGSDPSCVVVLDAPDVAPIAVVVVVGRDAAVRLRRSNTARADGTELHGQAVLLDREPVGDSEVSWPLGGELQIGQVLLEVHRPAPPDAALQASADGAWLDYNRPPRLLPPPRQTTFRLPKEPSKPHRAGIPLAAALAPAVLGIAMAVLLHQPSFLLLALMSPMMMFGQFVSARRQGKKTYRQEIKDYKDTCEAIERDAADALVTERHARRVANPDPASLLMVAVGPRARLWERRRTDPDHLSVRVGTVDLESEVMVEDPEQLEHRREVKRIARDVPVALSLPESGVVGVAGRFDLPRRISTWLVGQLAVLQSPRDVSIYVLTTGDGEDTWRWTTWLPHLHPAMGQDAYALIAHDAETLGRRIAELSQMVATRQAAKANHGHGDTAFTDPDVVVVLDGARRLRSMPGVPTLLREGPAVGVYSICLDADERQLPEECGAVITESHDGLYVRRQRAVDIAAVRADLVPAPWFQRVARAICPIRDVSDSEDSGALPPSSRLLDVIGLEPPTDDAIVARWRLGGRSTEAVVGESIDGPFAIDLRRDGPHGLVADTTGSGKSEFLQTLVASLAVANRPDAMTFVLVDYKGGAAFKDCVKLPHTVGMVTDLDTHLVERALTSLGAELTRREHLLAAAGAKDLEDYVDYAVRDAALVAIPRLLIVIDEFASMARELPDFVTGLVNIAQRGRSLGIHLLLATQRPTGVVSPEIRANTNLRIALRVTDAAESQDVIEVADAAQISKSTPGRAYVQLGHASLVPFQSGRVGGRRPGTSPSIEERPAPWLRPLRWSDLGRPAPERPRTEAVEDAEITDLAVLVDAISQASSTLDIPVQHSPWLAALPDLLTTADLDSPPLDSSHLDGARTGDGAGPDIAAVPYGLEDLPAAQEQRVCRLDLATFGHLFIAGAPRSGRSQVLRTIAGMLARHVSTADVHLFGIDCGNGALLPLTRLPNCGAVVQRTQTERASRLISRLNAEVQRRQELLGDGGFADITEQRAGCAADERLPHLVVLLDRWEGFVPTLGEVDGGTLSDILFMILREGASVGVHVIMTGDRTLLSGRVSTLTEDKLVLRLTDRGDYSLAGLNAKKWPEDIVQGRAFRADSGIETHIAVLGEDPSGPAQAKCIAEIADAAAKRDADLPRSKRPFRVDVLPTRLAFDEAWGMRADNVRRPMWGLVGVGGDELLALGPDLSSDAPTFVIAGPPKSGRSTVLLSMTLSMLRGGAEVLITAPRTSPLRELEGRSGVRAVLTDEDLMADELTPHLGGDDPVVLVMDDAEMHKDFMAGEFMRSFIRVAGERTGVVIAGNIADVCSGFMGWQIDIKKNRSGVLLSPQDLSDGDLVGVRVPRSMIGGPVQPGRGLMHLGDGELTSVQVPLVTVADA